jgi:hypothetical protein
MTAPGAGDVASQSPPCLLLRRTLALTALSASLLLCHFTTALLHLSFPYDGYPCFRNPAAAHRHALGLLIAIWPVLFVMSPSFNFPVDESIAIPVSLPLSPAGSLASSLQACLQAHPVDLHAEDHLFCVPLRASLRGKARLLHVAAATMRYSAALATQARERLTSPQACACM